MKPYTVILFPHSTYAHLDLLDCHVRISRVGFRLVLIYYPFCDRYLEIDLSVINLRWMSGYGTSSSSVVTYQKEFNRQC